MGLWPFMLKRTVCTKIVIEAPYEQVLETLHNAPALIELNPLVGAYGLVQLPSSENTYHVQDNIKVMGCNTTTKYTAKFTNKEDGTIVQIEAPGAMTSLNHWTARKRMVEGKEIVIVEEEAIIEAPFITLPFILSTVKKVHPSILKQLKIRLEGNDVTEKEPLTTK